MASPNPYAATLEPATSKSPPSDPLLDANCRTNFGGRVWPSCQYTVCANRIDMKFLFHEYNLPIERVQLLRSAGKGVGRHLELVHDDPLVPEKLIILPLYPAHWYDTFETLGIATEDESRLRHSSQFYHRSSEWLSLLEPFMLPIALVGLAIYGLIMEFFR